MAAILSRGRWVNPHGDETGLFWENVVNMATVPPGPIFCLLLGVSSGCARPISNLACDWLSIVWAYSKQETENGPRTLAAVVLIMSDWYVIDFYV